MKKTILVIAILLSGFINVQKVATYDQVKSKEVKGKIDTYISKQGIEFSVGDTITLGHPINGEFSYINPSYSHAGKEPLAGMKMIITKLLSYNKHIFIYAKGDQYKIFEQNFQGALDNGEIETGVLTREQAIAKLKEAKDLLELDMMTQEEYDDLKEELTSIIKG